MKSITVEYNCEMLRVEYTISDSENWSFDIEEILNTKEMSVYDFYENELSEIQDAIRDVYEAHDRELELEWQIARRRL